MIKAIKQPFADNGLSYTQFPVSDDNGMGVCTRLMHVSGQWLEDQFILPMVKRDPQAGASSLTYARRISLSAIAGIPTADDDAESAVIRGDHKKAIDDAQLSTLTDLLDSTGADVKAFCKHFNIASTKDLLASQFDQAVAALEAKASR